MPSSGYTPRYGTVSRRANQGSLAVPPPNPSAYAASLDAQVRSTRSRSPSADPLARPGPASAYVRQHEAAVVSRTLRALRAQKKAAQTAARDSTDPASARRRAQLQTDAAERRLFGKLQRHQDEDDAAAAAAAARADARARTGLVPPPRNAPSLDSRLAAVADRVGSGSPRARGPQGTARSRDSLVASLDTLATGRAAAGGRRRGSPARHRSPGIGSSAESAASPFNTSVDPKVAAEFDALAETHTRISTLPKSPAERVKQNMYRAQLEAQIEEKRRRKAHEQRLAREADARLDAEINAYHARTSPASGKVTLAGVDAGGTPPLFASSAAAAATSPTRGGGGSPLRDAGSGRLITNLRNADSLITRDAAGAGSLSSASASASASSRPSWYASPERQGGAATATSKLNALLETETALVTDKAATLRSEIREHGMRATQSSGGHGGFIFDDTADQEWRHKRELEAQADLLKQIEIKRLAKEAEEAKRKAEEARDMARIQAELEDMYLRDQEEKRLARATSALDPAATTSPGRAPPGAPGASRPNPAAPDGARPSSYAQFEALDPESKAQVRAQAELSHQEQLRQQIEERAARRAADAAAEADAEARENARLRRQRAEIAASSTRDTSYIPTVKPPQQQQQQQQQPQTPQQAQQQQSPQSPQQPSPYSPQQPRRPQHSPQHQQQQQQQRRQQLDVQDYRTAPLLASPNLARGQVLGAIRAPGATFTPPRRGARPTANLEHPPQRAYSRPNAPSIPKPRTTGPALIARSENETRAAMEREQAAAVAAEQMAELRSLRAELASEQRDRINRRRSTRDIHRTHQLSTAATRAPSAAAPVSHAPAPAGPSPSSPAPLAALANLPPAGSPAHVHEQIDLHTAPFDAGASTKGPLDFMKQGLEEDMARYGLILGYSPSSDASPPRHGL